MAVSVFFKYFGWHYAKAPKLMIGIWRNLLWYIGHIFSVDTLLLSLFAPWKRVVAGRTKRWDFEDYASALVVNLMSRLIGAGLRLTLVLFGRLMQLFLVVAGLSFFIVWFFVPFLVASSFVYGWFLIL